MVDHCVFVVRQGVVFVRKVNNICGIALLIVCLLTALSGCSNEMSDEPYYAGDQREELYNLATNEIYMHKHQNILDF